MKTFQYIGPYKKDQTISVELPDTHKILQIGVEHLHSTPIAAYENGDSPLTPLFKIDNHEYVIVDNDILEFQGLFQSTMLLTFLKNVDEYTIIDLVFKDIDE